MTGKKDLPIFCFNEHHEAFYFWHKARLEGYLAGATDLVHIDAHDDMAPPLQFSESIYPKEQSDSATLEFYRRFTFSQLTISNFILPAILSGVVRNVYFVYPGWRKFKPARKFTTIGSAFGEGTVIKHGVKISRAAHPLLHKAIPDLTPYYYMSGEARHLPRNRQVILDIDLDYFCCRDSITNHLSYDLEVTRFQFNNKALFLAEKTLPFSGLNFEFFEREDRYFARIAPKKTRDISHLPAMADIERELQRLISILIAKKIKPVIVTISRSCDSGYCPRGMAEQIEPLLMAQLKRFHS